MLGLVSQLVVKVFKVHACAQGSSVTPTFPPDCELLLTNEIKSTQQVSVDGRQQQSGETDWPDCCWRPPAGSLNCTQGPPLSCGCSERNTCWLAQAQSNLQAKCSLQFAAGTPNVSCQERLHYTVSLCAPDCSLVAQSRGKRRQLAQERARCRLRVAEKTSLPSKSQARQVGHFVLST